MAEPILAYGQWARRQHQSSPILLAAAVSAATLVTWIVTVERMQGMDAGPGTSLGGLGWFMGRVGNDDGGDDAPVGDADDAQLRSH